MRFKVGDKVKIKSFEEIKETGILNDDDEIEVELANGKPLSFTPTMQNFCGLEAVISNVYCKEEVYSIIINNDKKYYIEAWLEPAEPELKSEPIYVSSFDENEADAKEELKAILEQIVDLASKAQKIMEEIND